MANQTKPDVIADDIVVSLDYTLIVDGEVYESSPADEPIQFIQGHGQIIPGLESQLYGMSIGDEKEVQVAVEDGYGEIDPDAFMDVPRDEFPKDIPMSLGVMLEVQDEDGEPMDATISSISEDTIELNFNPPLAGKALTFQVHVADLRAPTEEELAHGHVHGDEFEDEDDDEYAGEGEDLDFD